MLLTFHLSPPTDIQMPLTFLYMNETPAAEEFGMKWGKGQQHAVPECHCTELGDGAKSEGLFRALQL